MKDEKVRLKIFHGPIHEVEENFNDFVKTHKIINVGKMEVAGLKDWSMGSKMPFVVLPVFFSVKGK